MMKNIAVLDDESTTLIIVKSILEQNDYTVETFNDPLLFLRDYSAGKFNILISDINMPQMNGFDVVKTVRKRDKEITIIMLTASTDLSQIISNLKHGISDYLIKPVVPMDLIFRIKSVLLEKQRQNQIEKIENEKFLIDLENKKLVNWRHMYAEKDMKQTEQLIMFLAKSINNGGGFIWLDFLTEIEKDINGDVKINKGLYDLIVESASSQRKAIDVLSYINKLPVMNLQPFESSEFVNKCKIYINEILEPMIINGNRALSLNINSVILDNPINIDFEIHQKILNELIINAIKYSQEESKIYIEIFKSHIPNNKSKEAIKIKVRNIPKESSLKDDKLNGIIGIPYDYSEIIFDLFYTMESYQILHDAEEWSNGTGLYISRKLSHKMGGWIDCKNITDFRNGENKVYVEFTYVIPTSILKIESEVNSHNDITLF